MLTTVAPPTTGRPPAAAVARRRAARGRTLLVALGGVALLTGLDAGLLRLGVWAPVASQRVADVHGQVMVLGFLATLISLERAQSLGRSWAYLAPGLYGAGALALVSPAPTLLGQLLTVEAGALFIVIYVALGIPRVRTVPVRFPRHGRRRTRCPRLHTGGAVTHEPLTRRHRQGSAANAPDGAE